jgi:hypothetical protein
VRDPSFSKGDLSEWVVRYNEELEAGLSTGDGNSDNTKFRWVATGTGTSDLTLEQMNVYIPNGNSVECNFFASVSRNNPAPFPPGDEWMAETNFGMYIDGQNCAFNYIVDGSWSGAYTGYMQVDGDYHTVEVRVDSRPNGGIVEVGVDDISVTNLDGPGAYVDCDF